MALFGLASTPEAACRQALAAAAQIAQSLDAMNTEFSAELVEPLRIAMGLHTGPGIVGDMGYGQAIRLTAVGDGINVASRLEGEAKELDVEAVISTALMRRAGFDVRAFRQQRFAIRGRVEPIDAVLVPEASRLVDGRSSTPREREASQDEATIGAIAASSRARESRPESEIWSALNGPRCGGDSSALAPRVARPDRGRVLVSEMPMD